MISTVLHQLCEGLQKVSRINNENAVTGLHVCVVKMDVDFYCTVCKVFL